jgi:hypothetical protein
MSDNIENNSPHLYSGVAIAATLAPLLGFYTLMITHHISRVSKPLEQMIHSYGHWIPGSVGSGALGSTGSYSGKEALALLVWLPIFSMALLLVTLGFIHPVIDPLVIFILGFLE